jgi:outer membrane scaffolding protein for murein synthesis (MipA/OmpV family)
MRRRLEIYVFSAAFCVMSFASPARAQDSGNDDNELTIGVGAAAIPTYDGSDDHVVTPGAIVRGKISGYSFFTRGTSLYLDVIRKRESSSSGVDVSFGPLATVRLTRTRSIKDPQVNALGKLDTAVEVGGWGRDRQDGHCSPAAMTRSRSGSTYARCHCGCAQKLSHQAIARIRHTALAQTTFRRRVALRRLCRQGLWALLL